MASRSPGVKAVNRSSMRSAMARPMPLWFSNWIVDSGTPAIVSTPVEAWNYAGVALHILDLGGDAIDTTSAVGLTSFRSEYRWMGLVGVRFGRSSTRSRSATIRPLR